MNIHLLLVYTVSWCPYLRVQDDDDDDLDLFGEATEEEKQAQAARAAEAGKKEKKKVSKWFLCFPGFLAVFNVPNG